MPDIDLDFPRDIREKLIVAVTERYGREHAALVASFATYRSRGAIRDVGKALGLPFGELERLARVTDGWNAEPRRRGARRALPGSAARPALGRLPRADARDRRPAAPRLAAPGRDDRLDAAADRPRAGQPAAMAGRQLCQWDKDSCSDAGFLKIDLLGLGMLSAVEEAVDQIARLHGEPIDLSRIPLDDPAVYAEIQDADTVGVFQIESRAQMQSLLRTRPENLDDLTSRSRSSARARSRARPSTRTSTTRSRLREDPSFVVPVEHESLREPLASTLGVVVFQDQVLDVAMALAGFSVGEAEGLRRAMSRKRSEEAIEAYRPRFVAGCLDNGIDEATAHAIYDKLVGFSGFGFPKSHAAAFALLAYQSAWLRHHYPGRVPLRADERAADGLLPAVLARPRRAAARDRGAPAAREPQRRQVRDRGRRRADRARLRALGRRGGGGGDRRRRQPYARRRRPRAPRAGSAADALEALVAAGRLRRRGARGASCSGGSARRRARRAPARRLGASSCCRSSRPPRRPSCPGRPTGSACSPTTGTRPSRSASIRWSCCARTSPASSRAPSSPTSRTARSRRRRHGGRPAAPSTAKGIVFMLLEDEHGQFNLIVPSQVYEAHRAIVRGEPLILARGRFERVGRNENVLVDELETLGPLARRVANEAEVRCGAAAGAPLRPSLTGLEHGILPCCER